MSDVTVVPVRRLELSLRPQPWPFAIERRAEIEAHFASVRQSNPTLWNGRVLMLYQYEIAGEVFRGSYLETDFASMLAWRHWNFADAGVKNCFAMGALRASDGAYLLGEMSGHTANAGSIYFPAGVPDMSDVDGGIVDLRRNVLRELREETGLGADDVEVDAGWTTVLAGPRIAQIKLLNTHLAAEELRARVLAFLREQAEPELSDVRIVRGPADLETKMPPFITAFLRHVWSGNRGTIP
ncbi:MAG: NUDIX hydrolase [Xanthobacteraceae bacterium]